MLIMNPSSVLECVTALRAWDEAHNVHVEDEPQPTG